MHIDPVLLCNSTDNDPSSTIHAFARYGEPTSDMQISPRSIGSGSSLKEAVRLAQENNFMGLICRSHVLEMVPALTKTVQELGLVIVANISTSTSGAFSGPDMSPVIPENVNGAILKNGVLRFNETIDI